jgi:hypothetical protein
LWLPFGVLENRVADFDAVGDREDARLLALPAIFQQHGPVWRKGLLHCSIIEKFAGVLYGSATRSTFFILQPKHAKRSGADIKTRLSLLFINQVDYVKLEPFLLFFADERDSRTAFLVTQQGIDAVVMLRNEIGRSVLFWCESSAVDDSPEFAVLKDQRVFHRGQLLIETDLVFVEVLASHKASFVVCLFGISVSVETSYLAALDAVAPNLIETWTRAVDEDHGFDDLLGGKLRGVLFIVLPGVFILLFGVVFRFLFSGRGLWRGLCLASQGYRDYKRGKSYEGQESTIQMKLFSLNSDRLGLNGANRGKPNVEAEL